MGLKDALEVIDRFGVERGLLILAILAIILLIIGFFKIESKNKKENKGIMCLQDEIKKTTNPIFSLIKELASKVEAGQKDITERINRTETELKELYKEIEEFDDKLIINATEQKNIVSNIDRILNMMMQMAIDLKGLFIAIKRNGNDLQ